MMHNRDSVDVMPETPDDLRRTLRVVNLRQWLPKLLCGSDQVVTGGCSGLIHKALSASTPLAQVHIDAGHSHVEMT